MNFKGRKLSLDAIPEMRICPVSSVQPYAPLPAPLYVLMRSNEKFLAIKSPLDFLTTFDLERLRSFDAFYYPAFVDQVLPFRTSARSVRGLIESCRARDGLAPAPYEVSDAFLRMTARLWTPEGRVEPFFTIVFVTELCGAFPEEMIIRAREQSLMLYEQAILKSSWAVWQALHLDYFDIHSLKELRNEIFDFCAGGGVPSVAFARDWLRNFVSEEMPTYGIQLPEYSVGVIKRKLESRQKRLIENLVKFNLAPFPSIFGEGGFYEEAG
ncbi:MAG: hypothetical protein KGQ59_07685 [Bdellovibrionales bacterium]|nr:hypothetical protein [Bdellovibrionales bacterium]